METEGLLSPALSSKGGEGEEYRQRKKNESRDRVFTAGSGRGDLWEEEAGERGGEFGAGAGI